MASSSAYGELFAQRLRTKATSFLSRSLHNTTIAATEVRSDIPATGLSEPHNYEDAYMVGLQLREYPVHECWIDGRSLPVNSLRAGDTTFYDNKREYVFNINNPFHSIHYYFPRSALNAIAEQSEAARIEEFQVKLGVGYDDEIIRQLTRSLLPAFEHPEQASRLFIEHVTLAIGVHVARIYGGMRAIPNASRGGLAPWQENRAKEILASNLDGDVSLEAVAAECGLSVSHFSRAFRQSTGTSPHRWLLARRIEEAKSYLTDSRLSLSDIALACGFADQSHFTRVFAQLTGVSPGIWRRNIPWKRPRR